MVGLRSNAGRLTVVARRDKENNGHSGAAMRVLFLGINYWPEEIGIGPFTTGRCEYLAGRGHAVTAVTAFPYYPRWRIPRRYEGSVFAREVRNGVAVLRSWLYVPQRVTAARRILHEASFMACSLLRAVSSCVVNKPDLLYVVSPPLGLGLVAGILSRLWKVPYVFHVADLQPDAAFDLGMLPSGGAARLLYRVENMSYRNAALVSTLTQGMRRRILSKGVPPEKVALFPDWADRRLFSDRPPERAIAFRKALGLQDRLLVVHAGNMGIKQGLEVVLDAAARSGNWQVTYLLVGEGAARAGLEKRTTAMGLLNVRFLRLLPRESFQDLMAAADICLVTQRRSVADIVFPSKLMTLLASGKPVIASANAESEVARALAEAGAGLVVEPENPCALLDGIIKLERDPELRREMGKLGRAYALGHWNHERLLPSMEAQLSQLVARGPEPAQGQEPVGGRVAESSLRMEERI